MYYKDLTKYKTFLDSDVSEVQNVGWLGKSVDYPTGPVSEEIIGKLKKIILGKTKANVIVNRVIGTHECNICGEQDVKIGTIDPDTVVLGSAEIWIPSNEFGYYAAPTLIYHYITEHNYQPPIEFLKALQAFDLDSEYIAQEIHNKLYEEYEGEPADLFTN